MKNLLLIIPFIILTLFSCGGKEQNESGKNTPEIDSAYCECYELTYDEPYNHFYRFERRKGYTGTCQEFYPNGQLKLDKHFVDGKIHGKMISYHDNGQIWEDQEFDMNFQVGERIIYTKSGQVKFHALYERGRQTEVLVSKPWLDLND